MTFQVFQPFNVFSPFTHLTPGGAVPAPVDPLPEILESIVAQYVASPTFDNEQVLFQDAPGAILVENAGDPIGRASDVSGSDNHWTQEISARRPMYDLVGGRESIVFDLVDDELEVNFAEALEGTMFICTGWGTYWLDISVSPGVYKYGRYERMPIEELVITDRVLSASEKTAFIQHLVDERGRKPFMGRIGDFSSSLENQWRDRPDIINFPLLDFGGVTSLRDAFRDENAGQWLFPGFLDSAVDVTTFRGTFQNSNITSIPAGLFDNCTHVTLFGGAVSGTFESNNITSIPSGLFANCPNVTSFENAFRFNEITSIPSTLFSNNPNVTSFFRTFNINNITSIPSGLFNNCKNVESFFGTFATNQLTTAPPNLFDVQTQCTNYRLCFTNNSLTQESVDNILVSISFSADQNDLDGGTLDIDGGANATPGPDGKDAADALRARGWTVDLNGY